MTRMRAVVTIPDSWACRCRPKPYVLATFRNEQLISVTRMHNRVDRNGRPQGCGIAPEPLDINEWRGGR